MADSTTPNTSKLLDIPQLAEIHLNHPPTGKAIQAILEYINRNVAPVEGNIVSSVGRNRRNPGGNP